MYDELVKELRDSAEWADRLALLMGRAEGDAHAPIMRKAADAIEELVRKEKFHAFLWNTIQPNEMEAYISMYNSGNIPQKPPKEETT